MSVEKIIVKTTDDPFIFQWLMPLSVRSSFDFEQGTLAELSAELDTIHQKIHIVFLAPALSVQMQQLSFDPAERKHLAKTVPYRLEEDMICDAAQLHCVMDKPGTDSVWVSAVQKTDLDLWLDRFEEVGLQPNYIFAEQCLLLQQNNEWCLYYDGNKFLLRSGDNRIHGVDPENLALALELATNQYENVPHNIDLWLHHSRDEQQALSYIPESLHSFINVEEKSMNALIGQRFQSFDRFNLVAGRFSNQSSNWLSQLKLWRGLMWLFLTALLVHVGVSYAQLKKTQSDHQQTQQAVKTLYESISPGSKYKPNSVATLKKKLGGGDAASSGSVLALLSEISPVLQKQKDFQVNNVSYSNSKSRVELDLLLNDHSAVNDFKSELQKNGMQVEIINSIEQGKQVRARLSVGGEA